MVSKPPWINKGVVGGRPFPPLLRLLDFQIGFKPPCEQSLFLSSSQVRRRKGWLCVNVSSHWSHRSPNVWTDQSSVGLQSNWFAEGEHPFIDKPLITEPTVPSARLLGLVQNCIISQQQAEHAQQRCYSNCAESLSCAPKSSNWKKGSAKRVAIPFSSVAHICPKFQSVDRYDNGFSFINGKKCQFFGFISE